MSRVVGITYDWDGPEDQAPAEGAVLQSKTRHYLILEVRRVNSRVHRCRLAIRAAVIEEPPRGARIVPLVWYKRGKKK